MPRSRSVVRRNPLLWAGAALLLLCNCLSRATLAEQSPAAWAVLNQVAEAYRDVYDLRFGYDAWVDYGDDGTVDATITGKFLFRLHEQAYVNDQTWQRAGGQPASHMIFSMLRGRYGMYTKDTHQVQGVLYRSTRTDVWTWGAGGITFLFDPLLIDPKECVAFLLGHERLGLRKCAHIVIIMRDLVGERRYRELLAMAERGEVPEDRVGANYWIDIARGVVLKYERVAYLTEPGKGRSEVSTWTTRATEVRRFQSAGLDIWLPVEVEEVVPPAWRHGPLGKVLATRGYKMRLVVVPDTVEINPRAPDDAYVIDPPPGTRLQEPGEPVDPSKFVDAGPAEDIPETVTVTKKMLEEADRQLRENGLEPATPRSRNLWRIGAFAAGAVLIALGLWLRRTTNN